MNDLASVAQLTTRRSKGFFTQFSLRTLLVATTLAAFATPFVAHWLNADRIPLESSSIEAVAYNYFTGTLEVDFRNDSSYRYFGVPSSKYLGLLEADSHGSYFHREIREADFRYEKIE